MSGLVEAIKMSIGIVAEKCGMTRLFNEDGGSDPVTVLRVPRLVVTQVKTPDNDGYSAIQVTFGTKNPEKLSKAEAGHFAKAGVEPGVLLKEFTVKDPKELEAYTVGAELKVDMFTVGQYVDVSGKTKGKGFAGCIKRHHFRMQDATHGNSVSHRAPGSIGQRQSPGKVFKGKKMSGHLGDKQRTIMTQKVVKVDVERSLIFVRGSVPGAENAYVVISPAVKKSA
jgi:large subunit ribosomal protein L3